MSLTIELTPAEESAIRAAAAREGIDVTAFVRERALQSLTKIDDLAFVRADSLSAVHAAQQNLLDKGIGYVVARNDGTIVRRFADGSETIISAVEEM